MTIVLKRTVRGVGYLGEGIHKPSLACGKINPVYNRWKALMSRCYDSESYHKNFSYSDAIISEEWLCFQNFAEWLTSQKMFSANWQIDKDLSGMKTYGSKYCYLLPQHLNRALSKFENESKSLGLPIGVVWHKKNQTYIVNSPNSNDNNEYVGSFHTLSVALEARKKAILCYNEYLIDKHEKDLDPFAVKLLKEKLLSKPTILSDGNLGEYT